MNKMDGMSMNLIGENVEQLKRLFPEAVTEGKIDFEVLKALLGGEIETRQEYYKFTWNGKEAARAYARTRSMGTLRPCVEESSGKDGTPGKFDSENLYIEGDNLEVLKLLQGAYHKKVKMIYIDPPYNTGRDFVYPDNYRNPIGEYKALTGQTNAEGKAMRAHPETSGRFHTDWLNMMYPRLVLARNLLTDDGVIFISIDDSEQDNLKKLCNEVFGEENFIAQVIWERAYSPVNLKKHFSESHDYIVCYARHLESTICNGLQRSNEANERYSNPDNDPRGVWKSSDLSVGPMIKAKVYEITTPSGRKVWPPNGYCWRLDRQRFAEYVADNRIWFGEDGNNVPSIKRFLLEVKQGITPMTIWKYTEVGHSQEAAQALKKLFGDKAIFDYPKSVDLIKKGLSLYSATDSIILDFFSGSATTAHAVMKLNAEDGGNRKYIMVQLPEPCEEGTEAAKAGYKNICEIGKERIRRAARKVVSDKWEVISVEEKARYGCKELSRADCLAKINGSGENDLFAGEKVTEGGTLCAVGSNAAGSGINSIQHSGRTGEELNEGISPISGNRTGQQGGAGNATASLRSSELPCPYGHFGSDATTSGSRENASCPYKNTDHCPLTTKYCSDMGFKVFKLDTSNLLPWNPNAETLAQDLYKAVDNVLADRSTDDLLYEILLKCNLPLTLPIEKKQFGGNTVYIVGMGALAICLDKPIPATIADEIVKLRDEYAPIVPMQVVFRDNGFDDVSKTNALQILKQAGFEDKSIQTI